MWSAQLQPLFPSCAERPRTGHAPFLNTVRLPSRAFLGKGFVMEAWPDTIATTAAAAATAKARTLVLPLALPAALPVMRMVGCSARGRNSRARKKKERKLVSTFKLAFC